MDFKRGQLSLFIILTILIVLVILFFSSYRFFNIPESPESTLNVKEKFSICFEENFILEINSFGKLYNLNFGEVVYYYEEDSLNNLNFGEVVYYYEEDSLNIPSIDFFEKEFQNLSRQIMLECIDFLDESDLIRDIDYTFNSVNVNIEKEIILVEFDLILNINDSKVVYLVDFNEKAFIFDSDFYSMHEFSLFFGEYLKENQERIPVKESLDFCNLRGIEFYYEEDFDYSEVVVYLVSKKNNTPEIFVFYNKLNYKLPIEGGIFL